MIPRPAEPGGDPASLVPPSPLANARRIVVKIGSAILIDTATNDVNRNWLRSIAADVAALKARGADVVIVSSGAIALGRRVLGLSAGALKLEESQAAAAAGQIDLAHAYREVLREHGLKTAQILITPQDSEERRRYLNARNTLETLLKVGAVPVVNENDTVATAEIRFGDNDRLAARVAAMIAADCLVLLSDIDGLYTGDPRRDPSATLVREVTEITPEIEAMAAPPPEKSETQVGSGGMVTKLIAARIALAAGCSMVITNGHAKSPLSALAGGAPSTWFRAAANPVLARKAWIATSLKTQGLLVIDEGAVEALRSGKSLLPAGVRDVSGRFERGDAVIVSDRTGRELARGLVAYSIDDARKIMGRKSDAIEALLGYRGRNEMIHRDDLVLTGLAERRTDKPEETR